MEKLNKLVELAKKATPGRNHDRLDSCGGGIKYQCLGDDGSLVLQCDHKNNEYGFIGPKSLEDEEFFLACKPETILAISEAFRALEQRMLVAEQGEKTFEDGFCSVRQDRDEWKRRAEAAEADSSYMGGGARYWHDEYCAQQHNLVAKIVALEAKLKELEKQEPVAVIARRDPTLLWEWTKQGKSIDTPDGMYLYARPAPAVCLAELVSVAMKLKQRYVCNEGRDLEFIACVTPERSSIGTGGVWDDWRKLSAILRNIEEAK